MHFIKSVRVFLSLQIQVFFPALSSTLVLLDHAYPASSKYTQYPAPATEMPSIFSLSLLLSIFLASVRSLLYSVSYIKHSLLTRSEPPIFDPS
jgi:hypothetical protein